jgi:F-type H+-transporting ATPase subunit b
MFFALAGNSIQLVPDGTVFIHILLIVLMVFILNSSLFRPINRILKEREEQTQGSSTETYAILKRINANLLSYEQALREARSEGYSLLEKHRAEALQERQGLIIALRTELLNSTEEEKQLIQKQIEQARLSLVEDGHLAAAEIGKQILHRSI